MMDRTVFIELGNPENESHPPPTSENSHMQVISMPVVGHN